MLNERIEIVRGGAESVYRMVWDIVIALRRDIVVRVLAGEIVVMAFSERPLRAV